MTDKNTSLAKITRPKLPDVFPRKRLFTVLDNGRKKPVTWVTGPAGSGKTTLVASYLDARKLPCLWYQVNADDTDIATFFYYLGLAAKKAAPRYRKPLPVLTPEYLQGVSTFTRRFFEDLYVRLKPPFAVVLDNYQEAPADSPIHDIVNSGLSLAPEGIRAFVLSRSETPPAFTRLRANGSISKVGWNDLRFTLEESKRITRLYAHRTPTEEIITELYRRTEGWAAGLVLMMEGAGAKTQDLPPAGKGAQKEVFNYFAGEVFDKLESETRDFLLMTAFLPEMTARTAEKMTDHENAGSILAALNRDHFFTEKHPAAEPTYQYHALFREFLLTRMKESLNDEGLLRVQRRAAALLEESGQVEDAVFLFHEARDWENLARLVAMHAQSLMTQGRIRTLEGWLRRFPEDYRENAPWLEYWLGACRMPFHPAESQQYFEHAYKLFESSNDPVGQLLSWAGVMEAILLGWGEFSQADRWIDMLEGLLRVHPYPLTPEIEARVATSMLFALTLRQPHHPDIKTWVERARAIARRSTNVRLKSFIHVYLELYYLWVGDHAGAEVVLEGVREAASSPDASPLAQILGRIIEAVYQVRMAGHDECRKAVVEGLEIAATTGVIVWNSQLYSQGAINALSDGNSGEAGEYLRKMSSGYQESRRIDACMYHYNSAWHELIRRDIARASRHIDAALRFALEAGTPFHEGICRVALAQVLHEQGEDQKAGEQLVQAHRVAARMKSRILDFMVLVSQAHFTLDRNGGIAALDPLAKAMTLGREQGYVNFYWWRPDVMARLCARALEAGLEVEYARHLIRKRRLVPDALPLTGENWPWPLKIHTLGSFELAIDGGPMRFTGKVQQKPLALLKALISFGGKDVPEERFIDALWPDADGDLAHKSFEMTVQRLRRLIGNDEIVQLQERRLSLDKSLCWIDVRELETLIERVDALLNGRSSRDLPSEAVKLSEKAITLYKGHFLPADSAYAWVLSLRERLRSKFLRLVLRLGNHYEQALQWEHAVEVFQKGLEVDGLAEEFYQHLMICYQRLGRRAEAIAVYNRCRTLLVSSLGIPPSPKTDELYQSIINKKRLNHKVGN